MQAPYRITTLLVLAIMVSVTPVTFSEPLKNLVIVDDGLSVDSPLNTLDDYIRLSLINPDYLTASKIKQRVENWLGPEMVQLQSDSLILIQAPRTASARVEFIAALLALELPPAL